jgi:lambda repressor-like predicted transcriptional regulator
MGGIVRGPKSGFPAMLHGNEMVIPLSPDSLLAELGKKGSDQFASETKTAQQESENISATTLKDDLIRANEMIAKVLTSKLDEVILKLDTGNQTSHKILRHSQV